MSNNVNFVYIIINMFSTISERVLRHIQQYFSHTCDGTPCAVGPKMLDLRSGSQCHRYFVGFCNVPIQAPTRAILFIGYSEKPPHLVSICDTLGIRMTYSHLNPPASPRGLNNFLRRCTNMSRSFLFSMEVIHQ